ncbi:MAG: hypothetical protein PUC33_02220 [Oscillospiraceae bacterium]|nr:hypothetical protein [Oscillospiraceae bacterium]MDD6146799.1 hypothetical protein [Oscillospiraceae bacterium]
MASYDIEDLEVEDVEGSEDYLDAQYDDDEEYEEVREFGPYDPAAAEEKWRDLDFEQLVEQMSLYVSNAKKFFFSKKKRIVDGHDIDTLVQFMQEKFPGEFTKAKDIMARENDIIEDANSKRERLLSEAQNYKNETMAKSQSYYNETVKRAHTDADGIIAGANNKAHELVQEHNITRMAREEAERIKAETEKATQAMIARTTAECNEYKKSANDYAKSIVQGAYNFITSGLAGYQSIAAKNLDEINKVNMQFQNEYAVQVKNLAIDTTNNNK